MSWFSLFFLNRNHPRTITMTMDAQVGDFIERTKKKIWNLTSLTLCLMHTCSSVRPFARTLAYEPTYACLFLSLSCVSVLFVTIVIFPNSRHRSNLKGKKYVTFHLVYKDILLLYVVIVKSAFTMGISREILATTYKL